MASDLSLLSFEGNCCDNRHFRSNQSALTTSDSSLIDSYRDRSREDFPTQTSDAHQAEADSYRGTANSPEPHKQSGRNLNNIAFDYPESRENLADTAERPGAQSGNAIERQPEDECQEVENEGHETNENEDTALSRFGYQSSDSPGDSYTNARYGGYLRPRGSYIEDVQPRYDPDFRATSSQYSVSSNSHDISPYSEYETPSRMPAGHASYREESPISSVAQRSHHSGYQRPYAAMPYQHPIPHLRRPAHIFRPNQRQVHGARGRSYQGELNMDDNEHPRFPRDHMASPYGYSSQGTGGSSLSLHPSPHAPHAPPPNSQIPRRPRVDETPEQYPLLRNSGRTSRNSHRAAMTMPYRDHYRNHRSLGRNENPPRVVYPNRERLQLDRAALGMSHTSALAAYPVTPQREVQAVQRSESMPPSNNDVSREGGRDTTYSEENIRPGESHIRRSRRHEPFILADSLSSQGARTPENPFQPERPHRSESSTRPRHRRHHDQGLGELDQHSLNRQRNIYLPNFRPLVDATGRNQMRGYHQEELRPEVGQHPKFHIPSRQSSSKGLIEKFDEPASERRRGVGPAGTSALTNRQPPVPPNSPCQLEAAAAPSPLQGEIYDTEEDVVGLKGTRSFRSESRTTSDMLHENRAAQPEAESLRRRVLGGSISSCSKVRTESLQSEGLKSSRKGEDHAHKDQTASGIPRVDSATIGALLPRPDKCSPEVQNIAEEGKQAKLQKPAKGSTSKAVVSKLSSQEVVESEPKISSDSEDLRPYLYQANAFLSRSVQEQDSGTNTVQEPSSVVKDDTLAGNKSIIPDVAATHSLQSQTDEITPAPRPRSDEKFKVRISRASMARQFEQECNLGDDGEDIAAGLKNPIQAESPSPQAPAKKFRVRGIKKRWTPSVPNQPETTAEPSEKKYSGSVRSFKSIFSRSRYTLSRKSLVEVSAPTPAGEREEAPEVPQSPEIAQQVQSRYDGAEDPVPLSSFSDYSSPKRPKFRLPNFLKNVKSMSMDNVRKTHHFQEAMPVRHSIGGEEAIREESVHSGRSVVREERKEKGGRLKRVWARGGEAVRRMKGKITGR
ncbi:MAG: hypothetical protein MMC23_003598 [Stictis urceolatum]|nr:hypothetical protein [Stictis urceolata]